MLNSKNNRTEWGPICLMNTRQNEANISDNNFNSVEFDQFKNESGRNSFVLTPTKWIKRIENK